MSEEKILGIGTTIDHPHYGKGVIVEINLGTYTVWTKRRGDVEISHRDDRIKLVEEVADTAERLTLAEVENVLKGVLRQWADITEIVPIAEKWKGGKLILQPGKEGLKNVELTIDALFHKIVMTRDRLRVMEQKVNASKLDEDEKIALQQYITRIYGSLTSFNVLFSEEEHKFKGTGGGE